jgi:hypothetical protein
MYGEWRRSEVAWIGEWIVARVDMDKRVDR